MSREMEQMFPRMSHEVEELFSPLNNSNLSDASLQLGRYGMGVSGGCTGRAKLPPWVIA